MVWFEVDSLVVVPCRRRRRPRARRQERLQLIATQGGLGGAFDAMKSHMENRSLLDRVCTPDDVRDAILAFVTGSRMATGELLVLDGGVGKAG